MTNLLKLSLFLNLLLIIIVIFGLWKTEKIQKVLKIDKEKTITYINKIAYLNQIKLDSNSIVFIGNSLIEQGDWAKLLDNKEILNFGIGGDVTEWILERIDNVLLQKPFKLFIMIGTNDLARGKTISYIEKNYQLLSNRIDSLSPDTKVYIHSLLPSNNKGGRSDNNIVQVNCLLKNICVNRNYTYVDVYSHFIKNKVINQNYTTDGLHLNQQGYLQWTGQLEKYLF